MNFELDDDPAKNVKIRRDSFQPQQKDNQLNNIFKYNENGYNFFGKYHSWNLNFRMFDQKNINIIIRRGVSIMKNSLIKQYKNALLQELDSAIKVSILFSGQFKFQLRYHITEFLFFS